MWVVRMQIHSLAAVPSHCMYQPDSVTNPETTARVRLANEPLLQVFCEPLCHMLLDGLLLDGSDTHDVLQFIRLQTTL